MPGPCGARADQAAAGSSMDSARNSIASFSLAKMAFFASVLMALAATTSSSMVVRMSWRSASGSADGNRTTLVGEAVSASDSGVTATGSGAISLDSAGGAEAAGEAGGGLVG